MDKIIIFISTNIKIKKIFFLLLVSIWTVNALGLSKSITNIPDLIITKTITNGPTLNANGTYDITFDFNLENSGNVNLNNLQAIDLLTVSAPVNNIAFGTNTPNLTLNNAFDGSTDTNLLAGTDSFAPAETGNFQLIINVGPGSNFTNINNQVDAEGTAPDGTLANAARLLLVFLIQLKQLILPKQLLTAPL